MQNPSLPIRSDSSSTLALEDVQQPPAESAEVLIQEPVGGSHGGRQAVIFALAATTSFLLYLHRYTWNLVRPQLEEEYGLSNTQLEALGSAFFFPYAAGQIPGGILCDLFGPHIFLVVIIIAWSLLLPLQGLTGNFWALLVVRGGFGLSQAGCYPALSQVTRAWFPLRRRTQVQGWIASAFGRGGGAMASIIMGTVLMGYFGLGWVGSLVVLSVVGVLFGFLFLILFRNSPEESPAPPVAPGQKHEGLRDEAVGAAGRPAPAPRRVLPFKTALKNRSYGILLAQQFINSGADVVFVLILGSYLKSLGVADGGQLGVLVSLPLFGGAAGGIFGGYANDWALQRFSSRRWSRAAVAGTGMGIGATLVVVAVASSDPVFVAVGLMIARFFTDWNQPTVWGVCTDIGGKFSATVFGMNNMAGNMGAFLTPFAVGLLLDYFSVITIVDGETVRQTDYVPAFLLCAGMIGVAALCWLVIDCTTSIVPETEEA